MKLYDIIRTANANMLRNKSRTFLTILAIFIGASTIMLTTGINDGVNDYIDRQVNSVGADGYMQVMPKSTADQMMSMMSGSGDVREYTGKSDGAMATTLTQADIDKMNDVKGVKEAKAYQMTSVDYVSRGGKDKKWQINVSVLPTDTIKLDMAAGRSVDLNSDEAQVVIPDKYVKPLGYKSADEAIGQTLTFGATNSVTKQQSTTTMKIVGVQNDSVVGFGYGWINDAAANRVNDIVMAGMPAEYRQQARAAVMQLEPDYFNNDAKIQQVKDDMTKLGYTAMTLDDSVSMMKAFFSAMTMILLVFGVVALIAASIGIINTLFMSVQERTREIGLMKAMGLGRGKIFAMFSLEAISLGFWGGILSLACTYLTAMWLNPLANSTFLSSLPGFTLIELKPLSMTLIILLIMVIAFLAGTLPARRAAGKDPIEALRYE